MSATIENPATCEVWSVIRFLLAKNNKPIEIYRLFLHDNARPYTANRTREVLFVMKWEVFLHLPYSPDLAPSDYNLFPAVKTWLATQYFEDDAELREFVTTLSKSQAAEFYKTGISKLVQRYE